MTQATSNVTTLPIDKAPRNHRSTRRVTERVPRKASQLAISKASQAAATALAALDTMPATPVPAPATVVARNVVTGPWTKPQVEVIRPDIRTVAVPPRRTHWALVAIAYGFFMLGIGINVWNAMTGSAPTDMALPAALGVLAEAVVFFLPAWAPTLPVGRQMLAWALFAFISLFALTNSLRMASITAADQATARVDRQTEGVRTADHALDAARAKRDEVCGRGLGKTVACKVRQAEVVRLEASQAQATANVAAQARPESTDFAKLVTWVSKGANQPGADDFTNLWLLFRTFLPQVGGLVLMLAKGRSA
jgi:hypothetical protein